MCQFRNRAGDVLPVDIYHSVKYPTQMIKHPQGNYPCKNYMMEYHQVKSKDEREELLMNLELDMSSFACQIVHILLVLLHTT
jgi:hypothetical protein